MHRMLKMNLFISWETVPSDLTKMTCNLKAPIIINTATMKAVQAVAANEDYVVRFPVYNLLKERKEKAGE